MEALSGLFVAIGVAAAAGLNAPLPLLLLGALDRWTGLVELASPWDALAQPEWLIGLSVLTALDLVGDKIPAVDHVLHVVGLVGAPVAGALAAMAGSSTDELAPVIAAVTGAVVAEGTHVARAGVRPVSTASTGGAGNPILSAAEDVLSVILVLLAVVVPVVAVGLVVLLAIGTYRGLRRVRRRFGSRMRT
jgi:Domain of unknown function (DUF4126)